ncbi:HTH-type transcriptional activator IlvY [Pontiella sulfatireligans]|uniref:Hydrogen peroxide-inducible genes activator n=1 Tax=Pontiella sulfatireligans TaxID=2750658 RepID=A0A6C2UP39_9BACT|nr:HTH-type transcriptional activator IlvY [Pontiella sulfatireligans]VGO21084.1 Hydrogen peroxide-inducible genes activator [Pontiella sulfatireligans]
MDIQALTTFIKTAELLHFGRASRACNLSPSALTRTIQRLEEELGQSLFLRDNRSVALTDAGRKLLTYARTSVQDWRTFQDSLTLGEEQVSGTLSIYASITAVYSLLPKLLESYRTAYPEVHLELRTGAAEQAIEQIMSGEIDLAVAALPDRKQAQLEFMPLVETPLVFIAPIGMELPVAGKNRQLDLSQVPLVVPQSGTARHRLDAWLRNNGTVPNIASEVSGNEALIAMVRLGTGVGVVPRLALERSPFREKVEMVRDTPQLDPYVVGLCSGKRNLKRPAVKAMWELAKGL